MSVHKRTVLDKGKRERWRRARDLVRRLYVRNSAGCCMHVVVDDGNVGDKAVRVAQHAAADAQCGHCLTIAGFLWALSPAQRRAFLRVRR